MAVSPDNENEAYFLTASFATTEDGGQTLRVQRGYPTTAGGHAIGAPPLGDFHDMWIDPANADRLLVSNDGGVGFSVNRGKTWTRVEFPNAQIYHVEVDNQIPYNVYGNRQDGPSFRGPSNSLVFGYGNFVPQISRDRWRPSVAAKAAGPSRTRSIPISCGPAEPRPALWAAASTAMISALASSGRVEVWPDQTRRRLPPPS